MVSSLDFKIDFYFLLNSKGPLACVLIFVCVKGDTDYLICANFHCILLSLCVWESHFKCTCSIRAQTGSICNLKKTNLKKSFSIVFWKAGLIPPHISQWLCNSCLSKQGIRLSHIWISKKKMVNSLKEFLNRI